MKFTILLLTGIGCVLSTSCGSTGLAGSMPIPFTDPPANAQGYIEVTPLPPQICIGLDVIPRPEEE